MPSILPTIVVVTTYMVINAMKVFDIVFVMGNSEANHTEVVAERMIQRETLLKLRHRAREMAGQVWVN